MRFGFVASLLLHACVVGLAFLSLPDFMRTKVVEAPVVPIDLIDEAELAKETSIPAMRPKVKPPEEKPPLPREEPKPQEEPKPAEPKPDEAEKIPDAKPRDTPPEKKPAGKKPNEDDLDLDELSKLLDKKRREQSAADPAADAVEGDRSQERIGAGDRLTVTEIDRMRSAVARCWNAGSIIGAPNPETLVVEIDIDLNPDGTLAGEPRVLNTLEISLSGNRFWKVAEQNAVRAVIACQPYDFFEPSRYQEWRAFTLNFDPSMMAGF
jgi:hypothetical protein